MKFERIDSNKFSCTISHAELAQMNLNLSELSYGTSTAKRFFHDILKKAEEEIDFEPEDLPLMIEAMPTREDGLIIHFSYVEEPDELDGRFAQFAPYLHEDSETEQESQPPVDPFANVGGADDILNHLKTGKKELQAEANEEKDAKTEPVSDEEASATEANAKQSPLDAPKIKSSLSVFVNGKEVKNPPVSSKDFLASLFGSFLHGQAPQEASSVPTLGDFFQKIQEFAGEEPDSEPQTKEKKKPDNGSNLCILFHFASFDDLVFACHRIHPFEGVSRLYKPSSKKEYLLAVFSGGLDAGRFNQICNMLSEYGRMEQDHTTLLTLTMDEHGECLIKQDAVEHLAKMYS